MSYHQRNWTDRSLSQCDDCDCVVVDLDDHECGAEPV